MLTMSFPFTLTLLSIFSQQSRDNKIFGLSVIIVIAVLFNFSFHHISFLPKTYSFQTLSYHSLFTLCYEVNPNIPLLCCTDVILREGYYLETTTMQSIRIRIKDHFPKVLICVRNLLYWRFQNFIFQSNSPTFPCPSFLSHDHSSSKQDKQFIWRHKYMVITSVAVVLVSNPIPSPFDTRSTPRSLPTPRQESFPPLGWPRSPHPRVLPSQTTGESTR